MAGSAQQLIGMRLGSATLKQLVGSGGMGMVYLAHQEHLDRDVAVKVLRSSSDVLSEQTEEFLERFRREAHVIAHLDHVNILPIYEYGEQNGLAYLIMPYLTGGSLYDRLQKSAPLPFNDIVLYTQQTASALSYAHAHKIIHRDIKPRNILFHADGRLMLVDFGIAHIMRDDRGKATGQTLTGSGHFIGSVDYMAPEMVRGKQVDIRTDIYELGVVLFQMFTGRLPFIGASPFIIAAQHLNEPAPSLLEINPRLTPGIDVVVRKALAKNPDERYQSTPELARALESAISLADTVSGSDRRANLPGPSFSVPPAFIARHPIGDVTQRIFTSEIPAVQQQVAGSTAPADPHTRTYMARQERVTSDFSPENGSPAMDSQGISPTSVTPPVRSKPQPQESGRHQKSKRLRWMSVFILLGLCLVLLTTVLLVSPDLLRQVGLSLPFVSSTATPIPNNVLGVTPLPTQSSVQLAQQVVRSYFDAINQQHYQDAYNLWGHAYQSSTSYDLFSSGFNNTQHDDIVIQGSEQLADGTVRVALILYATDKKNTSSVINAYQGSYIVGQEGGTWKLLDSSLAPVQVPSPVVSAS